MRGSVIAVVLSLLLAACNLNLNAPDPTPTPDLPTAQFLYPLNESTVIIGTDLEIDIVGRDENGPGIARIELLVDDQKLNERGPDAGDAVPVFTVRMNWLAQGIGRHALTAIAYRANGLQSDPVTILVNVLPIEGE